MSGQRIPYPSLPGALVESINALLLAGELRPVSGDGAAFSIAPFPAPEAGDASLCLGVAVGGSPLRVRLNRAAVEAAVGALVSERTFAALDNDLKMAVLELALDRPLAALGELLGAEATLDRIEASEAGPDDSSNQGDAARGTALNSLTFEVRLPADVVRCRVVVELLAPLPDSVLAKLSTVPASPAGRFGDLHVPVTFELGRTSMSAADFGFLEPGDILLLDPCHVREGRLRINVRDGIFHAGTFDGLDVTVEHSS